MPRSHPTRGFLLAVVAPLALLSAACGSGSGSSAGTNSGSGASADAGTTVTIDRLNTGDCFNRSALPDDLRAEVSQVSCSDAHGYEVIFNKVLPGDGPYPKGLRATVAGDCSGSFAEYVGIDASAVPSVSDWVMYPDRTEWAHGKRHAFCLITPPANDAARTREGSAKGKAGSL